MEPTGSFEDDPNLSDKKFPGNPARSYHTRESIRVLDEVRGWQPHSPEMRVFDTSFDYITDKPTKTKRR